MPISADRVRTLHPYDIKILFTLERLMRRYLWVPLDTLRQAMRFSESDLTFRLGRLMEADLVKSSSVPYPGYQLVFSGFDTLALITLTRKGSVTALGALIGEGKEALVYEGLGFGTVALKFHRVGQRSFQTARRNRAYMPETGHCPWIFASSNSARREYEALVALYPSVQVPAPIDQNRNVVVMSFIAGATLNRCILEEPGEVLSRILDNYAAAYRLGFIHGDLSEYNVMADGEDVVIIDWPQWVEPDHPNADEILRRDIDNVVQYFRKKYDICYPAEEAYALVVG
ncbi:MAG: serine/threonine protein phosphatase [Methanomicrobiales archaeon]|nr:serine/threonine protein phosphatase [Methanomicrobiales archaeon]